jgi:hypothetical protein
MVSPDPWTVARGLESRAAELRINLLRLVALVTFYGFHLVKVYSVKDPAYLGPSYHGTVSVVALAWGVMVVVLHACLSRDWAPSWLMYAVVGLDLILATVLLTQAGDPRSPLLILYFVILASASLRLSSRLVLTTTGGAVFGYFCLVYYFIHFEVGSVEYEANPTIRVSRGFLIFIVMALAGAGLLASQGVRQSRRLTERMRLAEKSSQEAL